MTPDEIRSRILASEQLKALAREGRDGDIARDPAMAEATTVEYRLTSLGVLDLFGPVRGAAIMAGMRIAAQSNAVLAEIVPHMDLGGVNVGHADAPTVFGLLVQAGICTQAEADAVLALAVRSIQPSVDEVSRALRQYRPLGKVGKYSSEELK